MKRTLLAVAVLGAFAHGASAQSSVTLFGVVDLGALWLENGSLKQYQLAQGGLSSSRLGIRGTEDLGGGLRAGFWLEGELVPDTGTPGGQNWRRRSTVSILNALGEVRLGRDYSTTRWNTLVFDPFGNSGIAAAGNLTLEPPDVRPGGRLDTLNRVSNSISYSLPSGIAGGLYGQLMVAAGENVNGRKYIGGRVGYAAGPFNVALAYGQTEVYDVAGVDADNVNAGASWDFGAVELSGYYGQIKVEGNRQNNWFVGASAPFGQWRLRASYGQADRTGTAPVNLEGQKATQIAAGVVYDLSKRTAFYGTWSSIDNKGGASFIVGELNNVPDGGGGPDADSQGFMVGLKHSF